MKRVKVSKSFFSQSLVRKADVKQNLAKGELGRFKNAKHERKVNLNSIFKEHNKKLVPKT